MKGLAMARWNIGAWTAVALSMTLLACGSVRQRPAPVADWAKAKKTASAAAASAAPAKAASEGITVEPPVAEAAPKRAPVGVENAGKTGYYTVQKGDTLIRIGLDAGDSTGRASGSQSGGEQPPERHAAAARACRGGRHPAQGCKSCGAAAGNGHYHHYHHYHHYPR